MALPEDFKEYIKSNVLFTSGERLLLAVSGGVDSVVLCKLCYESRFRFSIAHCNFMLRNEESMKDEAFVVGLAATYKVPVFVKRFDTKQHAEENKTGIQETARELRYAWFRELIAESAKEGHKERFTHILTAHHADDNIETILMNFFKGTGIRGLKGMLPAHDHVIRPLLFATKETLIQYAANNKLEYREDASNNSNQYTRNYLRNELLPAIEKVFPNVKSNLFENARRFRDIHELYLSALGRIINKLLTVKGEEVHIPILALQKSGTPVTIIYEISRPYGFSAQQAEDILKLAASGSGKYLTSSSHRILHNRNWLIISPLEKNSASHFVIGETDRTLFFSDKKLVVEKVASIDKISSDTNIAQLDASRISFPLIIRKWERGDYFYPLGMKKKKKLSRFFIDQKLSVADKEKIWVVESDRKIVWIIGHRINDRCKITDHTKAVVKLWVSTPKKTGVS
jgi:tRNA(Ile)-lysidine synthase